MKSISRIVLDYFCDRVREEVPYEIYQAYTSWLDGDGDPIKCLIVGYKQDAFIYLKDSEVEWECIENYISFNSNTYKVLFEEVKALIIKAGREHAIDSLANAKGSVIKYSEDNRKLIDILTRGQAEEIIEGTSIDSEFYEMDEDFPYRCMGLVETGINDYMCGWKVCFYNSYDDMYNAVIDLKKAYFDTFYDEHETIDKMVDELEYGIKSGQVETDLDDPDKVMETVRDFIYSITDSWDGNRYEESILYYCEYIEYSDNLIDDTVYEIATRVICDLKHLPNPLDE